MSSSLLTIEGGGGPVKDFPSRDPFDCLWRLTWHDLSRPERLREFFFGIGKQILITIRVTGENDMFVTRKALRDRKMTGTFSGGAPSGDLPR